MNPGIADLRRFGAYLAAGLAGWLVVGVLLGDESPGATGTKTPGIAAAESPPKSTESEKPRPPPIGIEKRSQGFDVVPDRKPDGTNASLALDRQLRAAAIHIRLGAAERGNVQEFETALLLLDAARRALGDLPEATAGPTAESIARLRREAVTLRDTAQRTLVGRFPLIRAFGVPLWEDNEELEVGSYSTAGEARRQAIRKALTQLAYWGPTMPLDVLILLPQGDPDSTLDDDFAAAVDAGAHEAFLEAPNLKLFAGGLRAAVPPMPVWDAPDSALDPICRAFLKRIDPARPSHSVMLVMVREFTDAAGDGHWIQAQHRTFEASTLEKAEGKPEKLEADKVRIHDAVTRDRSRFNAGTLVIAFALFGLALLVHEALSRLAAPHSRTWVRSLGIPAAGFGIGLALTPLVMFAVKRWLPQPETSALSAAWWPCTAGGLALMLPAGVFRLVAGSLGRYVSGLSCHGRWGIVFVPVALGASAAWVRPALYAFGWSGVTLILAIACSSMLLVYCFGRAIDLADRFPVALMPIVVGLSLIFGAGALLGSSLTLGVVCVLAGATTAGHTLVSRRHGQTAEADEAGQRTADGGTRRPRTLEQLKLALQEPRYQPPPAFERLRKIIQRSGMTQATWIGLVGPTAAGKTAAVRHLISELTASGEDLTVLTGRCSKDSSPYEPFREALAELGVSAGLMATRGSGNEVNTIFERLADEFIPFWDFFSRGGDDEGDEATRGELLAAVTNGLHTLLQNQRVVLFLDDVQWIDDASAALLRHLRETFTPESETPLIVVVASRDPRALEKLGLSEGVIAVSPPSAAEQVRILERSLGIETATARYLVGALGVMGQETEGMFWLIRAVSQLVADKALEATPRGFALRSQFSKRGPLPVPAAMRAKLVESLRASGQYQPVMECAALLGEKFRVDDLAECLGMDRLKLLQILRHLEQDFQLVRDIPSDPEHYTFSSTFMHEIVRDELGSGGGGSGAPAPPSKIARELHARIAAVLERRTPRTANLAFAIAQHYFDAGQPHAPQAIEHCLAASGLARRKRAFVEARRYLAMAKQAANLAKQPLDLTEERRRLQAEEAGQTEATGAGREEQGTGRSP